MPFYRSVPAGRAEVPAAKDAAIFASRQETNDMTDTQKSGVAILGIFAVDVTFLAPRLPAIGETLAGSGFVMGPGGKGSNQAVAAARAGGKVSFITKIGKDAFGDIGLKTWAEAGATPHVQRIDSHPTGSAFIFVNDHNGQNAIIVYAGASGTLTPADLDLDLACQLREGGPWGQGFAEPLFDNAFDLASWRLVGGRHWRLDLRLPGHAGVVEAILFNAEPGATPPARCHAVYQLDVNEWNGRRRVQLVIRHLQAMEP